MRLFQFSLRDQASNRLECLPARSFSTWEDLTTRFLNQLFPPGRTAKLRNDILMFQQHQGESLSEAWTRFKDLLQIVPRHGIKLWLQVQIFYDYVNPTTRRTINQSGSGKLRDRNAKESWALLEDLSLYDNESWNKKRDFAKPVKAISLPQDAPSTSDRHLIELKNQVQRLMEAHLAPKQPIQVNKITFHVRSAVVPTTLSAAWKILSKILSIMHHRVPMKREENEAKESAKSSATEYKDHEMTVESEEEFEEEAEEETEEEEEDNPDHFYVFPTMKELGYHEWLLKNPRPPWVKAKIRTRNLNNVKFSYMIGHFDKKEAYLDVESPVNVMSRTAFLFGS
ncbi:MAK10-like protein [Tanacetum coccineum]|uniref:MAK10-like protein n=1 Tax=Tanacetum coccineum TaxID=301880 RepID=A0ABQ4YCN4_9ASTR